MKATQHPILFRNTAQPLKANNNALCQVSLDLICRTTFDVYAGMMFLNILICSLSKGLKIQLVFLTK